MSDARARKSTPALPTSTGCSQEQLPFLHQSMRPRLNSGQWAMARKAERMADCSKLPQLLTLLDCFY